MQDLQSRLNQIRERLERTSDPQGVTELENEARALLSDAKNTAYEEAAQALFAEVIRRDAGTNPDIAVVRNLVRRARIRIEIAGDADDIDEAIDILSEGLPLAPANADLIALLQQAATHNPQAFQRVSDLFHRYGITAPLTPSPTAFTREASPPAGNAAAGTPGGRQESRGGQPVAGGASQPPAGNGADIDSLRSQMTEAYYAGDYQVTIEVANRILSLAPQDAPANEYRQKSEDNLVRGVVPDHRIPFDARVAFNRANSLVRAGNYEEAARLYREARDRAEHDGILSWKDVEQALLDIQDLALAREMVSEGDRLMAADQWSEALRQYEGALRVLPNDPQTEERIDNVRRVQKETDQIAVQLNMLAGSVEDQATELNELRGKLARVRQRLPNSQRLASLGADVDKRLVTLKLQLVDQAQSALRRAEDSPAIDDRIELNNAAIRHLEMAIAMDPGDTSLPERAVKARAQSAELNRARQTIERASALIAQNFDAELSQARAMLASLGAHAQDERYRAVVNDLLSRYLERAEYALEERNLSEAGEWLSTMQEEPFRILGRRTEIFRLENDLKRARQRQQLLTAGGVAGVIVTALVLMLLTRGTWEPVLFPPPTATPTVTLTPTISPTPSITPSATWTWTPSWTPTASETPTITPSPTPSETFTVTPSPTITPSITPTPQDLCRVVVLGPEAIFMRTRPTTNSQRLTTLTPGTAMSVLEQTREAGLVDGPVWYRVRVNLDESTTTGWVRADTVTELTECPVAP